MIAVGIVWWYASWNQSYTWAGARNFHQYLRYQITKGNVVESSEPLMYLRMGDVLALTKSNTKTTADHIMMVTSIRNGKRYLSGHTSDRKDKPWNEIDPHSLYYGWGVPYTTWKP